MEHLPLQGYHGDTSRMFYVGKVSEKARRLCEVTQLAMDTAIAQCGPGVPIRHIGKVRPR
jgi:methionyl aminopeptidase